MSKKLDISDATHFDPDFSAKEEDARAPSSFPHAGEAGRPFSNAGEQDWPFTHAGRDETDVPFEGRPFPHTGRVDTDVSGGVHNSSLASLQNEPLTRLRQKLALAVLMHQEMTENVVEQFEGELWSLTPIQHKKLVDEQQAIEEAGFQSFQNMDFVSPYAQTFWAIKLAAALEQHKEKVTETPLWDAIVKNPVLLKDMRATLYRIANALHNTSVKVKFTIDHEPSFAFDSENNVIQFDVLWSLMDGLDNAAGALMHEIGHSQLTFDVDDLTEKMNASLQAIEQKAKAENRNLTEQEYRQMAAIDTKRGAIFQLFQESENNVVNRYALNQTKTSLIDMGYALNATEALFINAVAQSLTFMPESGRKFYTLYYMMRYSFYKNNHFFENMPDWQERYHLDANLIQGYDAEGKKLMSSAQSVQTLFELCTKLETMQPSALEKMLARSSDHLVRQKQKERNQVLEQIVDRFVMPFMDDMISERQKEISEQKEKNQAQKQSEEQCKKQCQKADKDGNQGRESNQQGQGKSTEQEQESGSSLQNQDKASATQNQDKASAAQSEQDKTGSNPSEPAQEQESKGASPQETVQVDDLGAMPKIDPTKQPMADEQKRKQKAYSDTSQEPMTIEQMLHQLQQSFDQETGQLISPTLDNPFEKKRAPKITVGTLNTYQRLVQDHQASIRRLEIFFSKFKERQFAHKNALANTHTLMPEDSISERLNPEALNNLMRRRVLGQNIYAQDRKVFLSEQEKLKQSVPIDILIGIDTSGSMSLDNRLPKALSAACILYEAARRNKMNVFINILSFDDCIELANPTTPYDDIAKRLVGVKADGGSDFINAAIEKMLKQVKSQNLAKNKLVGDSHIFIISDGEFFEQNKKIEQMLSIVPNVTLDFCMIGTNSSPLDALIAKGEKRVGKVNVTRVEDLCLNLQNLVKGRLNKTHLKPQSFRHKISRINRFEREYE